MSFDDQFRPAFDNLAARLRRDVARHLDAAIEELTAKAETIAATAEVERATLVADAAREARLDAEQSAEQRLAAALAEAERIASARLTVALAEAEKTATQRVAAATTESDTRAEEASRQREVAAGQRLVAAFRAIDGAQSLSDILAALATAAADEAARVAIFLASDTDVRSWRFLGFEPALGPDDNLTLSAADAGIIADAMHQRQPASAGGDTGLAVPPFADLPGGRRAIAVPLIVNDEVVVVLYADEGPQGSARRSAWASAIEVLARHAGRALEAITAHRLAKTLADRTGTARPRPVQRPVAPPPAHAPTPAAPTPVAAHRPVQDEHDGHAAAVRYARELVSEIRATHEPMVVAGIRDRDLTSRLGGEIAHAWSQYEARVPESIRANTNYFHSELVKTLANGDASLLTPNS